MNVSYGAQAAFVAVSALVMWFLYERSVDVAKDLATVTERVRTLQGDLETARGTIDELEARQDGFYLQLQGIATRKAENDSQERLQAKKLRAAETGPQKNSVKAWRSQRPPEALQRVYGREPCADASECLLMREEGAAR